MNKTCCRKACKAKPKRACAYCAYHNGAIVVLCGAIDRDRSKCLEDHQNQFPLRDLILKEMKVMKRTVSPSSNLSRKSAKESK
jgi:hypothetical protein